MTISVQLSIIPSKTHDWSSLEEFQREHQAVWGHILWTFWSIVIPFWESFRGNTRQFGDIFCERFDQYWTLSGRVSEGTPGSLGTYSLNLFINRDPFLGGFQREHQAVWGHILWTFWSRLISFWESFRGNTNHFGEIDGFTPQNHIFAPNVFSPKTLDPFSNHLPDSLIFVKIQ